MRLKLDENMPRAFFELLCSAGHDVSTVPEENLGGADDVPVMSKASQEGRLLITFDTDFGHIREFPIGTPTRVSWFFASTISGGQHFKG